MTLNTFNALDAIKATALWWSPIVAGFIGALGIHLLTRSREREKWILDSKKEEYKELLSALCESYVTVFDLSSDVKSVTPEDSRRLLIVQNNVTLIFRSRLYIRNDLLVDDLSNRWLLAMRQYERHPAPQILTEEFEAIRAEIIRAANRTMPK